MVICRLILGIFGDFQNFQFSRFQIPEFLEILWKLLHLTNCKILGIFPTQFRSLSLILNSEFQNSNFSGNFWNFRKLSGNTQTLTIFAKWNIFSTQFWSLSLIFHLKVVDFRIFRGFQDFLGISRFPISRFPISRFQKILDVSKSYTNHFCKNLAINHPFW